jgi:RNA polymerase sigma-70 factor (ECF subfamily)
VDYKTLPPAELMLHCLRTGEESAWGEFVRRFQPLIAGVAFRIARQHGSTSSHTIDDLVQETYLKLYSERLRILRSFTPASGEAVYGYVKVFTANLVKDHFKEHCAAKRGGAVVTTSIDESSRVEHVVRMDTTNAILERKLLLAEVRAWLAVSVLGPHAERDCEIFWLYYRLGYSARDIAALPRIGLSTKGVESTILRLTRGVRHHLNPQRKEDGGEGPRPENSL